MKWNDMLTWELLGRSRCLMQRAEFEVAAAAMHEQQLARTQRYAARGYAPPLQIPSRSVDERAAG